MSEIREMVRGLRQQRRESDAELCHVTEAQMSLKVDFTLEQMITRERGEAFGADVRWMFLRRADHLEEHMLQTEDHLRAHFGVQQSQAHRYWSANQEARGDLYASLTGLADDDLDDEPPDPPGEWSLRKILEHLIVVEGNYRIRAVAAVEAFHAGRPYRRPDLSGRPQEWPGATLAELIEKLDDEREQSLATLLGISNEGLRAPMQWNNIDIDVRFQLMRFAQHEREHTQQIRKWRQKCDKPFTEAHRLIGLYWQRGGRLEGILAGAPDDVLDRDPGDGEWTIRAILEHLSSAERYFKHLIDGAIG